METRAEYQTRARAYVEEHGRKTPTEIYQAIGDPPEGVRLAADGKGNVRARDVLQRRVTQGVYNRQRAQRAQPKGEIEAAYDRSMRRAARQRSDDLIHKLAYGDAPSIAEHNQPLHQGGDASRQSFSEPPFKTFKDTVESKLKKYPGYVTDIDDVTGGVRVIEEARYNQYQKPSQQRGITLEIGDDIDANLAKLKPRVSLQGVRGGIRFGTGFRAVLPGPAGLMEFVPMIDEITGGHLEKTVDQGIESVKGAIRFAATSVRDAYADTKPLGYDLNLQ